MCDIPGCINISDDILVFGKGQDEHDQCLEKLFKRAREKGITFNKDKCECNKDRCLYYGMVFSKEGASPDPAKVEAIKEAEPLCNAKELHSFLCTMQYNAQFIESYTLVGRAFLLFTRVFNMFEIPEEIKLDNGPPSNGSKFWNVAQEQGFLHCKVTTAWAEANGDIECLLQMLKKGPKTAGIDLKGNPFDRKLKKPLATIMLCPTQGQSRPWTSSHWEETYVGNYLKEGFEWPGPEVRCVKEKTDERVCRQKEKCSRTIDCHWWHSPFETEQSWSAQ